MPMKSDSVTFRVEPAKLETLDTLAKLAGVSRSTLLGQALDNYLELQAWQTAHIQEGLRQAQADDFVSDDAVAALLRRKRQ